MVKAGRDFREFLICAEEVITRSCRHLSPRGIAGRAMTPTILH